MLIRGRRHPIVGTVSMDNFTVEVGLGSEVEVGDEVTLIGAQDGEAILAKEAAVWLGTINYEVTWGISPASPESPRSELASTGAQAWGRGACFE